MHDAGEALGRGDPLRALNLIGTVDGALALMLRGIAYAQIGDFDLAKTSLQRAVDSTSTERIHATARAALAEIALNAGDPMMAASAAKASAIDLERLGDLRNASMQRLTLARAEVLLGRLGDARRVIEDVLAHDHLEPDLLALASLAEAEVAIRSTLAFTARDALWRARRALESAPNPLLERALVHLDKELSRPIARLARRGVVSSIDLFAMEEASRGEILLIDTCRRLVVAGRVTIHLARRPILFSLLAQLGRAWPESAPRDELAAHAFEAKRINASHRSRLRVEMGRLRKMMEGLGAEPVATATGYALEASREVAMLLPPSDADDDRVTLLLGDGALWSSQGLAEHAGISKRTAQRALSALVEKSVVMRTGKGHDLRYFRPGTPIATRMLLLGLVPKS
ncbi:MAG: helix-turn-helix domain-containing protein [Polyangiaceae bacterium]